MQQSFQQVSVELIENSNQFSFGLRALFALRNRSEIGLGHQIGANCINYSTANVLIPL